MRLRTISSPLYPQTLNSHGRAPLRVGNTPIELKELPTNPQKGLRELFRNTQTYKPQISAYLKDNLYEAFEAFSDNPQPALHLETNSSGRLILTLGKIERPSKDSIFLDYSPTLATEFSVPKGIEPEIVFKAEERALSRDLAWIINSYIKKDGAMRAWKEQYLKIFQQNKDLIWEN